MNTSDIVSLRRLLQDLINSKEELNKVYDRGHIITHKTCRSAQHVLNNLEYLIYGENHE